MAHFFLEVCYSESILKAGAAVARGLAKERGVGGEHLIPIYT